MVNQLTAAVGMGIYVMAVLYATKIPYTMMVERGMEHIRAVYYNRKIVHMLAGGVGSLSVPFLFTDVWYPMVSGILLTALLFASHRAGIVMHWFQTEQNQNDVKFGLMWWMSISLIWWLVGDPWLAIVPSLFMAFGDGVTGVVRNAVVRKRSKAPSATCSCFWSVHRLVGLPQAQATRAFRCGDSSPRRSQRSSSATNTGPLTTTS